MNEYELMLQAWQNILADYNNRSSSFDIENSLRWGKGYSPLDAAQNGLRIERLYGPIYNAQQVNDSIYFDSNRTIGVPISNYQRSSSRYIGGSPEQSRNIYFDLNPQVNEQIEQISSQYNLPRKLLRSTLSVEGSFIDVNINHNNNSYLNYTYTGGQQPNGPNFYDILNEREIYLPDIGYDIVNEEGEFERLQNYLQRPIYRPDYIDFENERGTTRASGSTYGDTAFQDAIELVAAKNKQLSESVKSEANRLGISLTDEQLSYWTNLYWNTGEYGGKELFNQYAGQIIPVDNANLGENRITSAQNGQKFLRQYNSFANGGTIVNTENRNKLIVGEGVNFEGIEPTLRTILTELSDRGISFRVTSGKSDSGHSENSRHYTGEAVDITPIEGQTYEELLYNIRRNPDIVAKFQDAGYGLLDETKGGGQGWTGAHLHIGRDSKLDKNNWNTVTIKDGNNNINKLSDNAQYATEYFLGRGLSPIATAGIVGNLIQESSENILPTSFNKKEGAFGIAQWRGERADNLYNFANNRESDPNNLTVQLDYLYDDLINKYPKAFDSITKASTPEQAASIFNKYYERSADKEGTTGYNRRINSANLVYSEYNKLRGGLVDSLDGIVNPEANESLLDSTFSNLLSSSGYGSDPVQQYLDYYMYGNQDSNINEKDLQRRAKLMASEENRQLVYTILDAVNIPIIESQKIS